MSLNKICPVCEKPLLVCLGHTYAEEMKLFKKQRTALRAESELWRQKLFACGNAAEGLWEGEEPDPAEINLEKVKVLRAEYNRLWEALERIADKKNGRTSECCRRIAREAIQGENA